jgi:hypothetical protein
MSGCIQVSLTVGSQTRHCWETFDSYGCHAAVQAGRTATPASGGTTTDTDLSTELPEALRQAMPSLPTDIFLVLWPRDEQRRQRLERDGLPRLLLVEEHVDPPVAADCLEDWVTVPTTQAELWARVRTLRTHAAAHDRSVPVLDGDGVLHYGSGVVAFGQVDAGVLSALLAQFGAVVQLDQLRRAGWPGGRPTGNALHHSLLRLRTHLAPLGLVIRNVRRRGYLLAVDTFGPTDPHRLPPDRVASSWAG